MALRPIIAVCGTTGVGKSKLAVELALNLSEKIDNNGWKGGIIVNADAMQAYKGFDTLTNKIPLSERAGVEHVLMNFKEPTEQYVVGQWVHDAIRVVSLSHLPIIVGGTAYWIQHLIFPGRLVVEPGKVSGPDSFPPPGSLPIPNGLSSVLSQITPDLREFAPSAADDPSAALALYNLLNALDPAVAVRWHWRDTRKVLRNLEIMRESGRRVSDILKEQSTSITTPRYDTLCFWLYAEPTELTRRLDSRADEMLRNNLLDEVRELRRLGLPSNDGNPDSIASFVDLTLGIFQSIGFREFHQYLADPSPSEKTFQVAIENMKVANRQYAKRQVSWIRNKFIPAIRASRSTEGSKSIEMYLLDATAPQQWGSGVRGVANHLMNAFLRRDPLPDPLTLSTTAKTMLSVHIKATDPTSALSVRRKVTCPVCTIDKALPVMIEDGFEWAAHVKTKVHKRLAAKAKGRGKQNDDDDVPSKECESGKGLVSTIQISQEENYKNMSIQFNPLSLEI
ncbi:IPP transferase-domain-containing protein [Multifurca ochricompacta]|uniref:IPP transferase-domain-containing protein n=1 Tax=Multifurca ochricompacta TaxID=376703 RepID=A0AAD4M976_9AGAM|nr:IPP transferase-domain-containing protein [Multifurca ochricompacta]